MNSHYTAIVKFLGTIHTDYRATFISWKNRIHLTTRSYLNAPALKLFADLIDLRMRVPSNSNTLWVAKELKQTAKQQNRECRKSHSSI